MFLLYYKNGSVAKITTGVSRTYFGGSVGSRGFTPL